MHYFQQFERPRDVENVNNVESVDVERDAESFDGHVDATRSELVGVSSSLDNIAAAFQRCVGT